MVRFFFRLDGGDSLDYLGVISFTLCIGPGVGVGAGVGVDQEPGVGAGVGVGIAPHDSAPLLTRIHNKS